MIDWGLEKPVPVGFDLGQLLIGLAHADELEIDAMPEIERAIVRAYCDGLAAEGWSLAEHVVREGFVGSLICRSALSAIPFPAPGPPPVGDETLRRRLQLTRYLLDLAATLERLAAGWRRSRCGLAQGPAAGWRRSQTRLASVCDPHAPAVLGSGAPCGRLWPTGAQRTHTPPDPRPFVTTGTSRTRFGRSLWPSLAHRRSTYPYSA